MYTSIVEVHHVRELETPPFCGRLCWTLTVITAWIGQRAEYDEADRSDPTFLILNSILRHFHKGVVVTVWVKPGPFTLPSRFKSQNIPAV